MKFGYATYWNANVITEISDGEIEIASVHNFDKLSPHTWGSKKIYVDSNFNNRNKAVFILTTKDEANKFKKSKILLGGQLIYDANNYCLYKYASYEKLKALK
ncbi:hypothetical protein FACS1894204_10940 [Synergistales bacterium]|nr:hypothetical protein FACS1894204_10940 [Synergistales bacterium]